MLPPLLTPEAFAAGTGGKVSADDPRLGPLLDGATAAVRRYCRWHIAPEVTVVDEHLDGPGGPVLSLPTMRLIRLDAITEDGTTLDPATIEWSHLGELRKPGRAPWTGRYGGITASYTHGLDAAAEVVQIIQQVVAVALSSPLGATREQAGIFAVNWATTAPGVAGGLALLQRDLALLDTYRLAGAP